MPDLNKSDKNKNAGVRYEYLATNPTDQSQDASPSETSAIPLADLMAKLKNMWKKSFIKYLILLICLISYLSNKKSSF